uniref:Uncharacterized protein n=1 Tax=Romanomermis culicivorax TaxID=13658 RepID=A0A915JS23_ROMCU
MGRQPQGQNLQKRSPPRHPLWGRILASNNQTRASPRDMEMRMLRWCLGLTSFDHASKGDVRGRMRVANIAERMREARLQWCGHVVRSDENTVAQQYDDHEDDQKRWMDRIVGDMQIANVTPDDACNQTK